MKISTVLATATAAVVAADFIDAAMFRHAVKDHDPLKDEYTDLYEKRIDRTIKFMFISGILGASYSVAKHIENR